MGTKVAQGLRLVLLIILVTSGGCDTVYDADDNSEFRVNNEDHDIILYPPEAD